VDVVPHGQATGMVVVLWIALNECGVRTRYA